MSIRGLSGGTGKPWFLGLLALIFLTGWLSLGQGLADTPVTPKSLAAEFDGLMAKVQPGDPAAGENAYAAAEVVDRLLKEFPKSLEARLVLTKNRLPNRSADIAALFALAQPWMVLHPELPPLALPVTVAAADPAAATESADDPGTLMPRAADTSLAIAMLRPPGAEVATGGGEKAVQQTLPIANGPPLGVLSDDDLHSRLRRASVLIYFVAQTNSGGLTAAQIGTGSFIGPNLVLTNAHVAEAAEDYIGTWLVINEVIGIRRATVKSVARRDTPIKIDAALLEVDGADATTWLALDTASRLDERIWIAGYPGDAGLLDQRYAVLNAALEQGTLPDSAQIPTALLNEGRINNFIADVESRSTELQYTMVTAPGNSGSPVVNACGDIVGLHYSGGASEATVKFNGAVHARDVALYLQYAGVPVKIADTPCIDKN